MTTRSEREKAQKLNEQHQAILSKLLREEDNKYCADCEAKGPRWASWNLGVFMCIRCAGIHRNLGVHISRVKSVNLDQWTPEQIQAIHVIRSEQPRLELCQRAVEVFVRDKYERKKYYDEALATASKECDKKKEDKKKEKEVDKVERHNNTKSECRASVKKSTQPAVDLLGLAGMYMGQSQIQFTPQGFTPGMTAAVPPTTMMGGGAVMSGMALPNGSYMSMQQQGVSLVPASQGQNMYNVQQGQWNMSQMTQQMSGMAMSSGGPTPGALNQPGTGWPTAPPTGSGQTLSTQLWK
ncbi:Stromal membrane-associated protein 1 [Channa argus]|uniref:Stromal membrane-associated protein 1 n=1 Tax=Channa argus TaxID=215402 RepID=A0A6G1R182_CHAAH|nr:Stromal membrane-associated protein 1 [Channa argus]